MDAEPEGEGWVIGHVGHDDFSVDAITQGVEILRSRTPNGSLKPIDANDLRAIIHEFYVVVIRGEFVGCFRVFQPDSLKQHRALELGSVVSAKPGVGGFIAEQAETISIEQRLPIVAITRGRFANILKRRGWKIRKRKYRERQNESCKTKALLEFKP